jgi:hypothetical protein
MKRDFPMYEGDGFVRNPAAPEGSLLEDAGKTAFAGPFVDFAEIDKRARRKRVVFLGGMFARLFDRIDASIRRAKYRELEKYLGESTDLADLERRLRHIGTERRNLFAQG